MCDLKEAMAEALADGQQDDPCSGSRLGAGLHRGAGPTCYGRGEVVAEAPNSTIH